MANMNFKNSDELFNFQAILSDVESRVAHEIVMRRQYLPNCINPQRELVPNPIFPNFHRPIVMDETENFDNSKVLQAPLNHQVVTPQASAGLFPCATRGNDTQLSETRKFSLEAMLFSQEKEMQVSMIDGTKPLINLLDKPINNAKLTNGVNMNGGNLDLLFLDLELKL